MSGGIGKNELSINEITARNGLENLCLANSKHLSYKFFNIFNLMNVKCTILKYLASLILSPIAIYAVLIIAKFFGANYEFTNGESFLIWLLMAILISNSVTWKK